MPGPETQRAFQDEPVGRWPLRAAGILLVVALVIQLVFYGRQTLTPQDALCLWWQQGCISNDNNRWLLTELDRVEFVHGNVRPHSVIADALVVQGTLINQATQVQRYPELEIRFFDLNGRTRAARQFQPEEYLEQKQRIADGIPPGKPLPVRLEVLNPGLSVLSFQFSLH